jgi:hypothetical protein
MNMRFVITRFQVTIETNYGTHYMKVSYVLGQGRAAHLHFNVSCGYSNYFDTDM